MQDSTPVPNSSIPECLDREIVQSLIDLGADDPTLFQDLVETFLADTPTRLDAMADAVRVADPTALERAAHGLKSSAGNLGARMLAELCHDLEQKGRAGDLGDTESLVLRARNEFNVAGIALRQVRI